MGRLHRTSGALAALALACSLGGCAAAEPVSSAADSSAPRHGGVVRVGLYQEPATLNKYLASGQMGVNMFINAPSLEPFLQVDPRGRRYPLLASRVPTVESGDVRLLGKGMQIRLPIRPAAAWSDGVPVTCEDVKFTWQTMMDDRWLVGSRVLWKHVVSVRCPGAKTALVTLDQPMSNYRQLFGPATPPLPAHELRGKDFNTYWNEGATVGTGPFLPRSWRRGVEIVLERNPRYWAAGPRRLPYLDRIVYVIAHDPSSLKLQLRTGEIDMATFPADSTLSQELESLPRADFSMGRSPQWEQIGFNTERAPTDDVHVRRAIAHAIDREQITRVVLRNQVPTLQSPLAPTFAEHLPVFERYTPDRLAVEREMRRAGYELRDGLWHRGGKPMELEFKTTGGNPLRRRTAELLQQQLLRNGIRMTLATEKSEIFFSQSIPRGAFHVAVWAGGGGVDPELARLFTCGEIPRKPDYRGKNNYRYCNPAASELIERSERELDVRVRARMLRRAQRMLASDVPVLPMFQAPDSLAWGHNLHGTQNNVFAGLAWNSAGWWLAD